jgi:predicted protein tyrosine phosphatase
MIPAVESSMVATAVAALTYYLAGWYSTPASEILPGRLWVGNIAGAWAAESLAGVGITHIVCATQFGRAAVFHPDRFLYHVVTVQDDVDQNMQPYFDETAEFIDRALQANGRVFVHCNQGRSRSVTLAAAYLMRYERKTVAQALETITSKRAIACPNPAFLQQLRAYETSLAHPVARAAVP